MRFIVQQRAIETVGRIRPLCQAVRRHDRDLFNQLRRAMNSVVLNIVEADGNDAGTARTRFATACGSAKEVRAALAVAAAWQYIEAQEAAKVDALLDEVCAMTWRLSGR